MTSCTFGGPGLADLYVTSAAYRLSPGQPTTSGGWPAPGVGAVVMFSLFEELLRREAPWNLRSPARRGWCIATAGPGRG